MFSDVCNSFSIRCNDTLKYSLDRELTRFCNSNILKTSPHQERKRERKGKTEEDLAEMVRKDLEEKHRKTDRGRKSFGSVEIDGEICCINDEQLK